MATRLYLSNGDTICEPQPRFRTGIQMPVTPLSGTTKPEQPFPLTLSRTRNQGDTQPETWPTSSVTGPTSGIQIPSQSGTDYHAWVSEPVDTAFTLSGTITLNLWSLESSMSANGAINAVFERIDETGATVSVIAQTARTTELGTSAAAANFTVSPTSTSMLKGDRIRVRIYYDDSSGATMASGFQFTLNGNGETAAANGDTYVEFTENFGFLTPSDHATSVEAIVGTGATFNLGGGGTNWTSPTNITSDNGTGASVSLSIGNIANGLMGTNLGFSIPANATVTGIEVEVDVISEAALPPSYNVLLTKNATGTPYSRAAWHRPSFNGTGLLTFGGPNDLWDTNWTTEEINASTFGAILESAAATVASTIVVDYMRVRVYYYNTGTKLYLTDTAGPAVGSNLEKEMWTSRGSGAVTAVTDTQAGWVDPIQITDSGGGTALEWYSKQLQAFTLSGCATLFICCFVNELTNPAGLRAELAVCDNDGSNVTVWCGNNMNCSGEDGGEFVGRIVANSAADSGDWGGGTAEHPEYVILAGPDISVSAGQRLRLRIFIDNASVQLQASDTVSFVYGGATNASGDSWLQLANTVSEQAATPGPTFPQRPAHRFLTSR